MAVTDLDDFLAALASPFQRLQVNKNSLTLIAGRPSSYWATAPFAGAAPTTAAVPTSALAGSIDPLVRGPNPSAAAYVGAARLQAASASQGLLVLCDRLSHQGGLSGTVTTVNLTTNLPTAALTRYTSGDGVMAAIEIYTQIGTTATTITCEYTNEAGGGGQVSQPIVIGATNAREAGRLLPISLEAGDTGVRSIENSTLLATTGTAGAFGYTLFRPLAAIPFYGGLSTDFNALLGGAGQLAEIIDDACLFWAVVASVTPGVLEGDLTLIES